MISLTVNDMTCGHCAATITKAIKAVDVDANVKVDLAEHQVHVESTKLNHGDVAEAIQDAGYSPVTPSARAAADSPQRGCCGAH